MPPGTTSFNPKWALVVPVVVWAILGLKAIVGSMAFMPLLLAIGLIGGVVAAVHHAEVIALKVGEPFGTLVLALSVTTIEVALIISMMLSSDGPEVMALPRDTLFAAIMIILNGIIGVSLLFGGRKNRIQQFNLEGVTDALCTMGVIIVLTMVLPNFVSSGDGVYSPVQLGFLAVITLVLFIAFTFFQTVLHRDYFIFEAHSPEAGDTDTPEPKPDKRTTLTSVVLLLASLVAVVLSAKGLSPTLEILLGRFGAPAATLGIIIAAIVLMPEFGASIRAARANRLQSSLNLAIGSAIASIGLTVPAVATIALFMGWPLQLGLDAISITLLSLSLFTVALSLRTGNTTLQPGVVHLGLFATYLFFSFVP